MSCPLRSHWVAQACNGEARIQLGERDEPGDQPLRVGHWKAPSYAPRRRRPPGSKITQLVLFEVPVQEKAAGAETASPYSSTPSDFISLILVLSLLNCLVPVRVPDPISSPPAPPLLDAVPIPSGSCVGRFHIAPLLAGHATKRWSRPQHSQS